MLLGFSPALICPALQMAYAEFIEIASGRATGLEKLGTTFWASVTRYVEGPSLRRTNSLRSHVMQGFPRTGNRQSVTE
ncbi:hypothetical protein BJ742DRAFT_810976 [Cladochytrium replicatum]|nr:hypothetical protein BJ742DRAFT_810976 [Cladochytrium replicatum]